MRKRWRIFQTGNDVASVCVCVCVCVCTCMRALVDRVPGAILGRPGHSIETGMK